MPSTPQSIYDQIGKMMGSLNDPINMFYSLLKVSKSREQAADLTQGWGAHLSGDAFAKLPEHVREGYMEGMTKLPDERYGELFGHPGSGNYYTGEQINQMLQPYSDIHRILLSGNASNE